MQGPHARETRDFVSAVRINVRVHTANHNAALITGDHRQHIQREIKPSAKTHDSNLISGTATRASRTEFLFLRGLISGTSSLPCYSVLLFMREGRRAHACGQQTSTRTHVYIISRGTHEVWRRGEGHVCTFSEDARRRDF